MSAPERPPVNDEENVVKVDFAEKRSRLGAKSKPNFNQSRTGGIIVLIVLITLGLLAHFTLLGTATVSP